MAIAPDCTSGRGRPYVAGPGRVALDLLDLVQATAQRRRVQLTVFALAERGDVLRDDSPLPQARPVGRHRPDATAAEVGEEVRADELGLTRATVDVASGDRTAERVRVLGDGERLARPRAAAHVAVL